MIKSMTAYARAENQTAPFTVRVEVRSYNSRHLDVALKLTHGFESLEERIKGDHRRHRGPWTGGHPGADPGRERSGDRL
jgi:uncharacterized protein YicC (UPF0701 family)